MSTSIFLGDDAHLSNPVWSFVIENFAVHEPMSSASAAISSGFELVSCKFRNEYPDLDEEPQHSDLKSSDTSVAGIPICYAWLSPSWAIPAPADNFCRAFTKALALEHYDIISGTWNSDTEENRCWQGRNQESRWRWSRTGALSSFPWHILRIFCYLLTHLLVCIEEINNKLR